MNVTFKHAEHSVHVKAGTPWIFLLPWFLPIFMPMAFCAFINRKLYGRAGILLLWLAWEVYRFLSGSWFLLIVDPTTFFAYWGVTVCFWFWYTGWAWWGNKFTAQIYHKAGWIIHDAEEQVVAKNIWGIDQTVKDSSSEGSHNEVSQGYTKIADQPKRDKVVEADSKDGVSNTNMAIGFVVIVLLIGLGMVIAGHDSTRDGSFMAPTQKTVQQASENASKVKMEVQSTKTMLEVVPGVRFVNEGKNGWFYPGKGQPIEFPYFTAYRQLAKVENNGVSYYLINAVEIKCENTHFMVTVARNGVKLEGPFGKCDEEFVEAYYNTNNRRIEIELENVLGERLVYYHRG